MSAPTSDASGPLAAPDSGQLTSQEEALWAHGERDYMAEYNAHKDEIFENLGGTFLQEIPL
jgi:hypothetical protein